ncbi:hypothetical protein ACLBXM_03980 [Xanthobacteraceae bacterium A53D]
MEPVVRIATHRPQARKPEPPRSLGVRLWRRVYGMSAERQVLLMLGFALVIGMFFALTQVRNVGTGRSLADARSPHELAQAVLGSSVRVLASSDQQTVSVHYDISAWALTRSSIRSSFQNNAIRLMPQMFARMPHVDRVELVADKFYAVVSQREVRQPALSVVFTRASASKVPWASVETDELTRMADKAWASPSIGWQ